MKQKHLGRLIVLLIVFTATIFASVVEATLDKNQIRRGDSVRLTIKANGKDINFPDISDIDGNIVTTAAQSTNFVYDNGKLSSSKSISYIFKPKKDTVIPSYTVKVDGKEYHTNELQLKVVEPTGQNISSNSPVLLEMNVSKTKARVGEPIKLALKFKAKQGEKIDRVNIVPPKLENFWVEQIPGENRGVDGDYDTVTYNFLITPQKSGELKIPATYVAVGKYVKMQSAFDDPFFDNSFFNQIKWSKVYSNPLTVSVEPLPDNLEVYGHFLMSANVDKRSVNANEPVNLTIKIKGEGNIDDIDKFNLKIPNAMVYADEPKVKKRIVNGILKGEFTQKIAIVADRNYTIPSIKFKYFDKTLQKVVTIKSNPIKITVKGSPSVATPKISTNADIEIAKKSKSDSSKVEVKEVKEPLNYLMLLIGFALGIGVMVLINLFKSTRVKTKPKTITQKIKNTKSDKELYELLLPYSKEPFLSGVVEKLDSNIYRKGNNKIDKDELVAYFNEVLDKS